jgi:hypothetical protein
MESEDWEVMFVYLHAVRPRLYELIMGTFKYVQEKMQKQEHANFWRKNGYNSGGTHTAAS